MKTYFAVHFTAMLLLLLCNISLAKIMQGTITLDSDTTEAFVTRFSFGQEEKGHVTASFTGHGDRFGTADGQQHRLELEIFDDKAYKAYLESLKKGSLCDERMKAATTRRRLVKQPPSNAEFSIEYVFPTKFDTQFYYFVVSDCSLEFYPAHPPTLDYEFHLLNGEGELPEEEVGLLRMNVLATVALFGGVLVSGIGIQKMLGRFGTVHLSTAAVFLALIFQLMACFFEAVHLSKYKSDGKGYRLRHGRLPLDFFSDTFQNLSESLAIMVVVSVAGGWTLIDGAWTEMKKIGKIGGSVFLAQFFIEVMSRRYEEDFSSFHEHDHWPGKLLMLARIVFAGLVVWGGKRALKKVSGTDENAAMFVKLFTISGAVYLLG